MEQDAHDAHLEEHNMDMKEESRVQKVKSKRKQLQGDTADNSDKRGVCYLSRVPPHMNPSHIRQLLSSYGEVQRIYLAPEGQPTDANPKRAAGFQGKGFSEGWVEFAKKSVAKRVAKMLNNEQIASKNRLRQQKMNMEISAAKRERDFYLTKIEQSLAHKHIQERRRKKQKTEGEESNSKPVPPKVSQKVTQKVPLRNGASGSDANLSESFVAEVAGLF